LRASGRDQAEEAEVRGEAGHVGGLQAQHALAGAEPDGVASLPSPMGRLQRQGGGGVGQGLAAAHGGEHVVGMDPAQDGAGAQRARRRQLQGGEGGGRREGHRVDLAQEARVDARGLQAPLPLRLREQVGRPAPLRSLREHVEEQRLQVGRGQLRGQHLAPAPTPARCDR